jgi:DUF4097 and DUF4098 domain-containing protein YvlB
MRMSTRGAATIAAMVRAATMTALAFAVAWPHPIAAQDGPGRATQGGGPQGGEPQQRARVRGDLERRQQALRERQNQARRARVAARQGPMASEPFASVVRIGRDGAFSLVNTSGKVTITGGGGDDVRIDATKRVWRAAEAEARAALPEIEIHVTERAGAVDVRTVFPRPGVLNAEVEYTITLPARTSVSIRAGSGDVRVTNVRGELRAEAVAGSITASSVGQVRMLRTVSGAIQLDTAESTDLMASTLGGLLTVRQLTARSADLRSMNGNVSIVDSNTDQVTMQSFSGRVEYTGPLARTGRYSLQSQSGDVRVAPSGTDDFEVEATAVNGSVRSEFPLTLLDERRASPRPSGRGLRGRMSRGARVMRGLSGDGGALVTLRSFSGDITIARR